MALRRLSLLCFIIAALVAAAAANSTIAYIDKTETLEDVRVLVSRGASRIGARRLTMHDCTTGIRDHADRARAETIAAAGGAERGRVAHHAPGLLGVVPLRTGA